MENKITKSLVIIGGGPAGLAAAVAAAENGLPAEDILILERDGRLGGILNQCIHNGFGLHTFKEELTGPEYAARFEERAKALHIPYKLGAMVLSISPEKVVTAVSREDGLFTVEAGAVILAMGCRERSRGALNIPGFRPAGVFSAGTAQRLVNMEGYMPGREVVILGSGDIGLIMARRMTLEGAKVHVVAELQPYSGGLKRNIVQCLDDFGIPLKLSHTVTEIHGKDRVTGVTISAVDDKLKPIPGTEEYYSCDTLLLSVGLIPENELTLGAGAPLSRVTNGPVVNESLETGVPGIFACGMCTTLWTMFPKKPRRPAVPPQSTCRAAAKKPQSRFRAASSWKPRAVCATLCRASFTPKICRIRSRCASAWAASIKIRSSVSISAISACSTAKRPLWHRAKWSRCC